MELLIFKQCIVVVITNKKQIQNCKFYYKNQLIYTKMVFNLNNNFQMMKKICKILLIFHHYVGITNILIIIKFFEIIFLI